MNSAKQLRWVPRRSIIVRLPTRFSHRWAAGLGNWIARPAGCRNCAKVVRCVSPIRSSPSILSPESRPGRSAATLTPIANCCPKTSSGSTRRGSRRAMTTSTSSLMGQPSRRMPSRKRDRSSSPRLSCRSRIALTPGGPEAMDQRPCSSPHSGCNATVDGGTRSVRTRPPPRDFTCTLNCADAFRHVRTLPALSRCLIRDSRHGQRSRRTLRT